MDRIFRGAIKDHKICLELREKFSELIASLEGKQVEIVLRKQRAKRSNPQNRYFHGVVLKLFADHLGYEVDELKAALKFKFLRTHTDGDLPGVRSTASLSTEEMTEFIEQIRRLAAQSGCYIPDPNEVDYQ